MTKAFDKAAACGPHTLLNVLDALAEQSADVVASVASGRVALSYSRLRSHVDVVAKILGRLGIGRNHRVAVALPNGPKIVVAFASIASFATCAPFNPAYRFDHHGLRDLHVGSGREYHRWLVPDRRPRM